MDEYLFFQNHKKILGKQNDQFLDKAAKQQLTMNRSKANIANIITKLEE